MSTARLFTRRGFTFLAGAASLCGRSRAASLAAARLGVTTDEIDDDLAAAVAMLEEFGLQYAEIRNLWGAYNTALPLEKIREARVLLDRHGIRTSVLDTAFFKIPLPRETPEGRAALDREWALLDAAMARAAILGTDKLRVFGFTLGKGQSAGSEEEYGRIWELLGEAARRARAGKVRLALENVGGGFVATGADAARMLRAVKDDALGLAWDPNNAGAAGERAFPDGYRLLDASRIIHAHLRDYRRAADGKTEWCAVGDGEFDNLGQIRALLKDGYKELFTLETHYRTPLGKARATRASLAALVKIFGLV